MIFLCASSKLFSSPRTSLSIRLTSLTIRQLFSSIFDSTSWQEIRIRLVCPPWILPETFWWTWRDLAALYQASLWADYCFFLPPFDQSRFQQPQICNKITPIFILFVVKQDEDDLQCRFYTNLKDTTLCWILSDSSLISAIAFSTILWWLELTLFWSPTCHRENCQSVSALAQFFQTWILKLSWMILNSCWVFLTSAISVSILQSFWSLAFLLAQILCNISERSSPFFSSFFSMSCKTEKC